MPAVGGGIGTLDNIREMFDAGVSKVSMNSAAVKNPQLVADAAGAFGSEKIIEKRRNYRPQDAS